jgi:uncharacterized coiled-coil DUF342 family protein
MKQKIDEQYSRMNEIRAILDEKQATKNGVAQQGEPMRDKLAKLKGAFADTLAEKRQLQGKLSEMRETERSMKNAARALKDQVGSLAKLEDVDKEIARLEAKLAHEGFANLDQEKRVVGQIADLKRVKDNMRANAAKVGAVGDLGSIEALEAELKARDAKLDAITKERDGLMARLNEVRDAASATVADIPTLIQERKGLSEVIKVLREELNRLRDEWKQKNNSWWDNEQLFRAQLDEERRLRNEARDAENKKYEAERNQERKATRALPLEKEITSAEALIGYLKQQAPATKAEVDPVAAAAAAAALGTLDGHAALVKVHHDDDFGSLKKAPKGGKKGKGGPKAPVEPSKQPVNLSLDALATLAQLKLTAPLTRGECAATAEAASLKLADLRMRQAAKIASDEAKEAAGDAASEDEGEEKEAEGKATPPAEEAAAPAAEEVPDAAAEPEAPADSATPEDEKERPVEKPVKWETSAEAAARHAAVAAAAAAAAATA